MFLYEPPHVNKAKLDREGRLQDPIEAPLWAVIDAWERVHMDRDFSDDEQEQENIESTQTDASQQPFFMANDHEASTSNSNGMNSQHQ